MRNRTATSAIKLLATTPVRKLKTVHQAIAAAMTRRCPIRSDRYPAGTWTAV
jgi:hypothetical protein